MADELPVKIGIDASVKFEATTEIPSEASGRAVNALIDAISPFTELLGLAGDKIRAVRESRVVERLRNVRAQLERSALPIHSVPDSFLLPWIEKTSQDEGEGVLGSSWEGMLASASRGYDSQMKIFPTILSEMTNRDVEILDGLISRDSDIVDLVHHQWPLHWMRSRCYSIAETILSDQCLVHFDQDAAMHFNNQIELLKFQWPVRFLGTDVPYQLALPADAPFNSRLPSSTSVGITSDISLYDNLLRLRMLEFFKFDFVAGFQIELAGVMATRMGIEFIQSCRGVET
ncbi:MAG: hypothetical protein ACKVOJ_14270 [Sphingomonadaceae bacterium]